MRAVHLGTRKVFCCLVQVGWQPVEPAFAFFKKKTAPTAHFFFFEMKNCLIISAAQARDARTLARMFIARTFFVGLVLRLVVASPPSTPWHAVSVSAIGSTTQITVALVQNNVVTLEYAPTGVRTSIVCLID